MLVEGRPKPDLSQKMITFGAYALVYTGITNNTTERAPPAISRRTSNNAGGYYLMSLHTIKQAHRYDQKDLSIDKYVIKGLKSIV